MWVVVCVLQENSKVLTHAPKIKYTCASIVFSGMAVCCCWLERAAHPLLLFLANSLPLLAAPTNQPNN